MTNKNYTGCSDKVTANTVACDPNYTFKSMVRQIARDGVILHPKTIYDIKHKTKQQITDILLEHERQFIEANPAYQYDNYRYEDGKHGERTIFLIFKKKPCLNPS